MLDFNSFPAMGYVPFQKLPAPVFCFFVPARTHSHQGPRAGAPWQERLAELRNGDNDSPRKRNRIPGEWGISQEWGPEIKEIEKRNAQPSLLLRPEWNKIHLWGGVESFSEKQQGVVTI